ncbi:MAG: winged helix-turn-helix transcriptional regulator [Anaerovoracaceae bacterium]|jgi:DNA-binding HxlR family transcriptional regulator
MENTMAEKEELCVTVGGDGCGLKKVLDIIGGKWKVLILCAMKNRGPMRYGELRKVIVGITNTMLAQSLKEMEADGLVKRKQYDEMPVRVEYSLTPKAEGMIPILLELKAWGEKNL